MFGKEQPEVVTAEEVGDFISQLYRDTTDEAMAGDSEETTTRSED